MRALHHLLKILVLQGVIVASANVPADNSRILVVTNNHSLGELSKKQIKQIYLQGGINFPVKPINLKPGDKFRAIFNAKIIGLTEPRIQAYWAQMRFTGRISPPLELPTIDEMIKFLDNNPGYIAYLPADTEIPPSLSVVYRMNY